MIPAIPVPLCLGVSSVQSRYSPAESLHIHAHAMNGQEAFRRLAQQIQRASSGGGGGGGFPSGKGFTAGGGLLLALIGGGVALNASLFNGMSCGSF